MWQKKCQQNLENQHLKYQIIQKKVFYKLNFDLLRMFYDLCSTYDVFSLPLKISNKDKKYVLVLVWVSNYYIGSNYYLISHFFNSF